MTNEMKCPIGYAFALRIPFHLLQCWCNTCTNTITNDMIHFVSSSDLIGSSILTSVALHRCLDLLAPSLYSSFPATRFVALKPLTHPSRLQPVHQAKSHLDLLHLVTWLHVMSHMQWTPLCEHCNISKPFPLSWHVLLTLVYLWTNHMCISHKHILVDLGCHSITKTKQGPFNDAFRFYLLPHPSRIDRGFLG